MITHLSATKNSFLFINCLSGCQFSKQTDLRSKISHRLAAGELGFSADGVVFIDPSPSYHFKWDFYNKDGSTAEMCGNAARGAALYARDRLGILEKRIKFETLAGVIEVEILDSEQSFAVHMTPWNVLGERKIAVNGFEWPILIVNSGVPHAVILVEDLNRERLLPLAREIRNHTSFGPAGTNVTFVKKGTEGPIHALTFERGVEEFTKSCGTGAVAAAIRATFGPSTKRPEQNVEIHVPGGDLSVAINFINNTAVLVGPAEIDYDIEIFDASKLVESVG